MFCNNTNIEYNQKSTLQRERHVINQNVNLYYTELLP